MNDIVLERAERWLCDHRQEITELSDRIWAFAEPGLREYRSHRALADFLIRHGYRVDVGIAGMPTAFVATYGSGRPVIGLMCEYDATPGDSQAAQPEPRPIATAECGFPDLHNGIGAASAGAAAALAATLAESGLAGTIRVFGTPAEKLCVGKPFLARDGFFDGLDAVVAWHPRPYTTVEWDGGPACYQAEIFDFYGKSAWGATPWAGISALDALTLMNINVQFLREHIPRRYLTTINELVTDGGQHPTAIPRHAQAWYVYRSPLREGIISAMATLARAAQGACVATGATYESRVVTSTRPWLPNHALAMLCYKNLERAGAPRFPDEAKAFARRMLMQLGVPDDPEPFDETLSAPGSGVTGEGAGGADDVSEFSWHAPTARIYVAYSLRIGRVPNWVGAALASTAAAHATIQTAAKAMAFSTLELLQDQEQLATATAEFQERTKDSKLGPLLDASAHPPVDETFGHHYPIGWRPPADRIPQE